MITKILTIEKIKRFFIEVFLNKTDKVSDVSDGSVLNANAYGIAKTAQKFLKDQALVESVVFPELAYGGYLDTSANLFGVSDRLGASGSSTYVLLQGTAGTVYSYSTTTFSGNSGIEFELEEDFTISDVGYGFAKVKSSSTGVDTNVNAESITTVTPEPTGHTSVLNLFMATGGRDEEDDEDFRIRIKSYKNISSQQSLAYILTILQELDSDVVKVIKSGVDSSGNIKFIVIKQNGVDYTSDELIDLAQDLSEYLNYTDSDIYGNNIGIVLENITWEELSLDFRVSLITSEDYETTRNEIQLAMSSYLDIRYWIQGDPVEWDDLLDIVKDNSNVSYVPDNQFSPSSDVTIPYLKLPRIKSFIMRDLDGVVLTSSDILLPVFYPNL